MLTPAKVLTAIAVGLTVPVLALGWGIADRLYPHAARLADRLGQLLDDAHADL